MSALKCHCGSELPFAECCEPFLTGAAIPKTAEVLMRSRYSAYASLNIPYLKTTLWPKNQQTFDTAAVSEWARTSHWTGLKILETEKGQETDRDGTVLFEARYLSAGTLNTHRELSRFRKKSGRWFYVEALDLPSN
ncbi:MAG: zinc chelation protein SecC [Rhodobacteraceae bacterium]|nr:zinc chelation protein SecC [Paracoccaceae bacterium]